MKKTKKVMVGVSTAALAVGLTGCGYEPIELPPQPSDDRCGEWEWEWEDGVWECDDYSSPYYDDYYYDGEYYSSHSTLYALPKYKSYKSSSSFKGKSGFSSTSKSGFGSGSRSFGG